MVRLQTRPINWCYKQSGIGVETTFESLHRYTILKRVVINLEEGVIGDFHAPPPNAFV
jgi:hypothetical protein